jgi:hypothetical protein
MSAEIEIASNWSIEDLCQQLARQNMVLIDYLDVFRKGKVTGKKFVAFKEEDLISLGIDKKVARNYTLKLLDKLNGRPEGAYNYEREKKIFPEGRVAFDDLGHYTIPATFVKKGPPQEKEPEVVVPRRFGGKAPPPPEGAHRCISHLLCRITITKFLCLRM